MNEDRTYGTERELHISLVAEHVAVLMRLPSRKCEANFLVHDPEDSLFLPCCYPTAAR